MDITKPLVTEFIKTVFGIVSHAVKNREQDESQIEACLEHHIHETLRWAEKIQFYGMANSLDIAEESIKLSINSQPRKFTGVEGGGGGGAPIDELLSLIHI